MLDAKFWQNKTSSQNVIKEKKLFEDLINSLQETNQKLKDLDELNQLAIQENNQEIKVEVSENLKNLRSLVKNNVLLFC